MVEDRFLKRLRKKAKKGLRGWPIATIAFYGPNLSQATKVTVGIVPSENAEVKELRDWRIEHGDIRADPGIAREILEFIENRQVLSVAMTDSCCRRAAGFVGRTERQDAVQQATQRNRVDRQRRVPPPSPWSFMGTGEQRFA